MLLRFIIAFVLVALVGGGIVGFNMFRDQAIEDFFANMPVAPVTVSTMTVEPVDWTPGIAAIGTVSANQGVDLTVEAAGVVTAIEFASNQKVEQGDLLLQLEDSVLRADVEAATTQAALEEQRLQRAIELQRRGVSSDVTVDEARAAASAAKSQVSRAQALLEQRQLKAPFGGTIGLPRIDVGQYVSPSIVVATLQDLETMRIDFSVPEQQFDPLRIGQKVRYGVTEDDMPFEGSIIGIDPKVDPATRLVAVRAEITNPEGRLNPGQYLQVRVELPREENVIALPHTAIVTSLYGDYAYLVQPAAGSEAETAPVAAAAPETASAASTSEAASPSQPTANAPQLRVSQVFVQLGRRSGGLVEIVEGIEAGSEVVTAGQNRLSNGAVVVVDNSVDPASVNQAAAKP